MLFPFFEVSVIIAPIRPHFDTISILFVSEVTFPEYKLFRVFVLLPQSLIYLAVCCFENPYADRTIIVPVAFKNRTVWPT
jgi:hypothetical protein